MTRITFETNPNAPSFGTFMLGMVGVIATFFGLASLGDSYTNKDREEKANSFIAKNEDKGIDTSSDPRIPGKVPHLRQLFFHLSKYQLPQAEYMVDHGWKLGLSAELERPLARIVAVDNAYRIDVNARIPFETAAWQIGNIIDYVQTQTANGLPVNNTCLAIGPGNSYNRLIPTYCSGATPPAPEGTH